MNRTDESAQPGLDAQAGLDAHVVVSRGGFRLDMTLSARGGQVVAVLGPNGAGKTTLLRAVGGLIQLTDGHLRVGTQDWDVPRRSVWVPAHRRGVGYVFADHRLFPHLNALENVAFGPRAQGISRHRARSMASETLGRFGLTGLGGRKPSQLSGGQAQRVALARAVASQPRLMLLDEPLAALDAGTRHEVRAELGNFLEWVAVPTILVTHDPVDAMMLADRLVVLEDGRVVQAGTAIQVAQQPVTDYVARLVGLNLYRGRMTDPVTGTVALQGGGTLVAADRDTADPPGPASGASTLVAVAPSAISLFVGPVAEFSARNTWPGTVSGIAPLTDRVRVTVRGQPEAIVDITPAALAQLRLRPGQDVWLSAKATEVKAYPARPDN